MEGLGWLPWPRQLLGWSQSQAGVRMGGASCLEISANGARLISSIMKQIAQARNSQGEYIACSTHPGFVPRQSIDEKHPVI